MHNGVPDGGSTATHSIAADRTTTVELVAGAAEHHGRAMSVQTAGLAEHSPQPTHSPRRQMPSGLSSSIAPVERMSGSLDAGSHDRRPEPGAVTAGSGRKLQSSTVAAAVSPNAVGGDTGHTSAGIAGGNVKSEVNRSQAGMFHTARELGDYQKQAGMYDALAPAPAPSSRDHAAQNVAGVAPNRALMAGPYQGNAAGIPTVMHSEARPFDGIREPVAFQVLGERLDSPPDVRALGAIMAARYGVAVGGLWSGAPAGGDFGRVGNGAPAVVVR